MGQQAFAFVETRADVVARRVVLEVEQDLYVGRTGREGVRGGVVLPEGGVIAGLPAFDGFGAGLVAGVSGLRWWAMAQRRTLARSVLNWRRRSSSLATAL